MGQTVKTINATLLANQKLPNGRGFALASLADNGRLHPTKTVSGVYTGGRVIGVECGSFYVRIRFTSGALDYQKVVDPTVAAQWTNWTNLVAANVAGSLTIGIFWTGTYVVVVYQELSTGDLKFRRSADCAVWSAAATMRTPLVANCNLAGVSGASPQCGLMEAYQTQIYWQAYNDSTNTWSAAESAGAVFSTALPEIAAFKDTLNGRYVVAASVQGFATWATYSIVAYTRATGSATWSAGQILFSGNGLSGSFNCLNFSQRQIGGYWWLSFYRFHLWNMNNITNYQVSASNDGLFWDDPLPTPVTGNEAMLTILPPPAGGQWAQAYMGLESGVWRLDTYTYWSNAAVVAYTLLSGRGGHQEGGGPNGRGGASPVSPSLQGELNLLIDNRSGALAAPRLFSVLTLTRGLVIEGVQYPQSAGAWYVTGYRFLFADGLLQLSCTDARGLLGSWFAETAYTYRGATIKFLVQWVCALAGVHTTTFDANAAWSDTISAFTHAAPENATSSLRSLAERLPFEYVVREDGSLYFYVPTAAPASVYTFGGGPGEHAAWLASKPTTRSAAPRVGAVPSWALNTPPWFGADESVTYLQFIASPPRNRVAEGVDLATLAATGRRRSLLINDRRVTTDAATTAAAAAHLVSQMEHRRAGVFDAPPSFALEPGDVISISGTTYPATAGTWRVAQFEERFNAGGARPFYQRLTLKGTA